MTQTTLDPAAVDHSRNTDAPTIAALQHISPAYIHTPATHATGPSADEIIEMAAECIAQWPEGRMYELLMALWRLGVDVFDLVPCVLAEMD